MAILRFTGARRTDEMPVIGKRQVLLHCMSPKLALLDNLLRCNGASAVEAKPAVIGVTA
jgi:hypothetical protein